MDAQKNNINISAFFLVIVSASLSTLVLSYGILSCGNEALNISLESRINPNVAEAASMVRLPQIGLSRAAAIIEYRKTARFESWRDLQNVKGIGPKISERLKGYLKFD